MYSDEKPLNISEYYKILFYFFRFIVSTRFLLEWGGENTIFQLVQLVIY